MEPFHPSTVRRGTPDPRGRDTVAEGSWTLPDVGVDLRSDRENREIDG